MSLLESFVPHLARFREVEMTDTATRLDVRGSGASKTRLSAFATAALAVARRIHEGRARIVPPASMAGAISAWRALARDLDGELSVADMGVMGIVLGMTATVQTLFGDGGAASGTIVLLELQHSVDKKHRLSVTSDCVDRLDSLPDNVARVARRVMRDASRLSIGADQIELTLIPAVGDARGLADRARSVGELARSLTGTAGPYR